MDFPTISHNHLEQSPDTTCEDCGELTSGELLCDSCDVARGVIARLESGDWIASTPTGRLWWCSKSEPGALVRAVYASEQAALFRLVDCGAVTRETKTYHLPRL